MSPLALLLHVLGALLIVAQVVVAIVDARAAKIASGGPAILEILKAIAEKAPYATAGILLIIIGLAIDGHLSLGELFGGDGEEDPAA